MRDRIDRRPVRAYPHEKARCRICGITLNYEINSIVWRNRADDLCPKHDGELSAKRILEKFRP